MQAPEEIAMRSGIKARDGRRQLPFVRYAFDVQGAPAGWRVRRMELREGISETYECVLELANDDLGADVAGLEGASCVVRITRGEVARRLCGLAWRVEWLGTLIDHLLIRVHVRPALAALGQVRRSRIFQEQSVADIVKKVLGEGLAPYKRTVRLDLDRKYKAREYCTQHAESDLDFVLRLMSEEGIVFAFEHSGDAEELVLLDLNKKWPEYPSADGRPVPVVGPEAPQDLLGKETIGRLSVGREMRSTGVLVHEYDWTRPGLAATYVKGAPDAQGMERTTVEHAPPRVFEDYEPSRNTYTRDDGALRARLHKEELDAGTRFAVGESNLTALAAGQVLEVEGQHLPELGTRFLVTRVEHRGEAEEEVQHRMKEAALVPERYRNRFTCAAFELPYRLPRLIRPPISGPQTATVVGPAGEEIFTDEHGRVKVQFHWDLEGRRDERSSCWVRVMQTWAGAGFGSVFIPRIGMEVVVQFLEGDPDRPLVVGCVYNGANPPPVQLPQDKTKSSITTRSSPGGVGYNEISFEDAADAEVISIHAQKDLQGKVLDSQSYSIGNNDSKTVGHNRSAQIGVDDSTNVGVNRTVSVGANDQLSVGGNRTSTIGANRTCDVLGADKLTVSRCQTITVKRSQNVKVSKSKSETVSLLSNEKVGAAKMLSVGAAYVITVGGIMNTTVTGASFEKVGFIKKVNAGTQIELSCGKSKIKMDKTGKITIEGKVLNFTAEEINCKVSKRTDVKSGEVAIEAATGQIYVKSKAGPVNIEAAGAVSVVGNPVDLNPDTCAVP